MFKLFELKGGKVTVLPSLNPKYIKGFFIASITMLLISVLSGWLKMDEKQLWKIYTAIIQHFGLSQEIPKLPDNQIEIDSRVELEVDRALREYQILTGDDGIVKLPKPKFIENEIDTNVCYTEECQSLGGEMRLCSPWVEDCKEPTK